MREQIAQHTIPSRASSYTTTRQPVVQPEFDVEDDDTYYPKRMPSSARRYSTTQG